MNFLIALFALLYEFLLRLLLIGPPLIFFGVCLALAGHGNRERFSIIFAITTIAYWIGIWQLEQIKSSWPANCLWCNGLGIFLPLLYFFAMPIGAAWLRRYRQALR